MQSWLHLPPHGKETIFTLVDAVLRDRREHKVAPCTTNDRDDGLDRRRWYGVCAKCGAKGFSSYKSFACPRCGNG